jgi:restriction endonuclease S subunit
MEKVKLGDVCKVQGGYAFKSKEFQKDSIPIIRIGNIQDNEVEIDYNVCFTKEFLNKHPEFEIKYGDILIAMSGATVGKIGKYQNDTKALLNQRVGNFIVTEKLEKRYLYFLLQSPLFEKFILNNAFGCAQPNISSKQIEEFEFYNYDNVEQIEIANQLDKVQEIIDFRKKQIQELDELIKSQFVEMFGDVGKNDRNWKYTTLGKECFLNPKKSELKNMNENFEVSFVAMPSVSENGNIDTNIIKKYDDVKKGFTYFAENDVLFAKITPCMENGKGAVAIGLKNKIGFGSTEFHVLRPKENINSVWLYTLTAMKSFRIEAERKMTGSAGQKRVPISFFETYNLGLPPIKLQNQFADIVKQIDKQKFEIQKSLEETQKLQESLMNKYFG